MSAEDVARTYRLRVSGLTVTGDLQRTGLHGNSSECAEPSTRPASGAVTSGRREDCADQHGREERAGNQDAAQFLGDHRQFDQSVSRAAEFLGHVQTQKALLGNPFQNCGRVSTLASTASRRRPGLRVARPSPVPESRRSRSSSLNPIVMSASSIRN